MTRTAYNQLLEKYNKYSYKKKCEILLEAIEYMQQHNGRTVSDCIVLAMGGEYADD